MKVQPMGIKRNFYASHSWKGKGLQEIEQSFFGLFFIL